MAQRPALLILLLAAGLCAAVAAAEHGDEHGEAPPERVSIVKSNWHETKVPMTIAIWVFTACVAKIREWAELHTIRVQCSTCTTRCRRCSPTRRCSSWSAW